MDKSRNINRQKKVEYSPLRIYELARMPWWVAENWRASWGDRVTLIPRIWSQSYTQAIRFTGKYLKLEKSQNSRTRKSLGFLLKSFKKMWSSWSLNKEKQKTFVLCPKIFVPLQHTPWKFSHRRIQPHPAPQPVILNTPGCGWVYWRSSKECDSTAVI